MLYYIQLNSRCTYLLGTSSNFHLSVEKYAIEKQKKILVFFRHYDTFS